MKKILCIILCLEAAFSACSTRLEKIREPVFVGRPNQNAFNGLVLLPDGEIRHYGVEGRWDNPSRPFYIQSTDNGFTWNDVTISDPDLYAFENMPPAVYNPSSGDYIKLICNNSGTWVFKSKKGIDGPFERKLITEEKYDMIRQPVFLSAKHRILVTCGRSLVKDGFDVMQSCVFYSDDNGDNWNISYVAVGPRFVPVWPHKKSRWQNYAIEPTIAELNDGRIWMLLRTSTDVFYESFSNDHGTTWSDPSPSRFYGTITMPTFFRLKDGRLLLFHCSTTPLPEEDRSADTTLRPEQKTGDLWEDVFTNRDVIHAAISDDDGKTWKGFRELYLNPLRNESDFATSGGTEVSLDKSVHQSQAIELPHGKVLVAFGQHPLVRAMVIFDPDWLYEKDRSDNFENGLSDWSTFKYFEGIKGHCAYNRDPGPQLIDNPDKSGNKVLQIRHIPDKRFVNDVDGAVWNFPAALKGSFKVKLFINPGSKGGKISLIDRWFNPTDTMAYRYSMYNLTFDGSGNTTSGFKLKTDKWTELTLEWNDLQKGRCLIKIDGVIQDQSLQLNNRSRNGINYVHFQSAAEDEDPEGYLIGSVKAAANDI